MVLFGSSLSPYVRKVLAFAAEKGIELEIVATGLQDHNPEFRRASPFGKMPALRDGDYTLADSSAIVHYFEAKYPEPNLVPLEPEARGQTIWFDEFADTILFGCGQKIFFNRVVAPYFLGRHGDEAAAAFAERQELPVILDYLEQVIPEAGYLVEGRLTLADIAVCSPFANLELLGIAVDGGRHPKTKAYAEAILSRASFKKRIERDKAFLTRFEGRR